MKQFCPTTEMLCLGRALNYEEDLQTLCDKSTFEDYYSPQNRVIFEAMYALYSKGKVVDTSAVAIVIQAEGKGGFTEVISVLMEMSNIASPNVDFPEHFKLLKDISLKRSLSAKFSSLAAHAASDKYNPQETICKAEEALLALCLGEGKAECRSAHQILKESFLDRNFVPDQNSFVSTGYEKLDKLFGGFMNGALIYIGARTSMGKTAFMINLILNCMKSGAKCGFLSLEMPSPMVTLKILCADARVDVRKVSKGTLNSEEVARLHACANRPSYANAIIDEGSFNITELKSHLRYMKKKYGIQIAFIDYLTRVKPATSNGNKHHETDQISKGLQDIAQELKIPVVCLAQLNRGLTSRENKRPMLSDFRESGSIEEDADVCMMLHRPAYYNPLDKPGILEVFVAKNRLFGEVAKVEFAWDAGRYEENSDIEEMRPANFYEKEDKAW